LITLVDIQYWGNYWTHFTGSMIELYKLFNPRSCDSDQLLIWLPTKIIKIKLFSILTNYFLLNYIIFEISTILLVKFRFRYSVICQGTSTRRQKRDHFSVRVRLPPVTTSLTTQSRGNPVKCFAQGHNK